MAQSNPDAKVTDVFILMLADIISPKEVFNFGVCVLKLPYATLENCYTEQDYREKLFKILYKYARKMTVGQIKEKFGETCYLDQSFEKLFRKYKGTLFIKYIKNT